MSKPGRSNAAFSFAVRPLVQVTMAANDAAAAQPGSARPRDPWCALAREIGVQRVDVRGSVQGIAGPSQYAK